MGMFSYSSLADCVEHRPTYILDIRRARTLPRPILHMLVFCPSQGFTSGRLLQDYRRLALLSRLFAHLDLPCSVLKSIQ